MAGHMSRNNLRPDPAKVSIEPFYPIDQRDLYIAMQSYQAIRGDRNTDASARFGAHLLSYTSDVGTLPQLAGGTTRQAAVDAMMSDLRTIQNAGEIPSPYLAY